MARRSRLFPRADVTDVTGRRLDGFPAADRARPGHGTLAGVLPYPIIGGPAVGPRSRSSLTGYTHQAVHKLYATPAQIRLAYPLFSMPGSNNLTPETLAGPLSVRAAVLWEYNGGAGYLSQVTFGGQRVVLTSYGQTWLVSDPVDVPPAVAAGAYVVTRTLVTQAPVAVADGATNSNSTVTAPSAPFLPWMVGASISGAGIPAGATIGSFVSTSQITISSPATATATGVALTITPLSMPSTRAPRGTGDITNQWREGYMSGDWTDVAGNSFGAATNDNSILFAPAIIGWPADGSNGMTAITGDSIAAGSVWSVSGGGPMSFAMWALHQAGVGAVNLAHSGEQLATVLAAYANMRSRLSSIYGCANVIDEYGINDLFAGNRTTAQLKADMLTWWGQLRRRGARVFRTTITPQTTSTDGWRTAASQASTNSTAETRRQQVNQWLRAPASAGIGNSATADAAAIGVALTIFDIDAAVEVNANGTPITINPTTGAISNGSGGFWITDATVYESGTISSIPSGQKLADSTKNWVAGQWIDYAMVITADPNTPSAVGQVRIVSATTSNQLTSDTAWSVTPSVGASYQIVKVMTVDGVHPGTVGHKLLSTKIDTTKLSVI